MNVNRSNAVQLGNLLSKFCVVMGLFVCFNQSLDAQVEELLWVEQDTAGREYLPLRVPTLGKLPDSLKGKGLKELAGYIQNR